jgi:hypothetical protein
MRTESGADDSWEDKAEKEDALAAATGGAAPAAAAAAAGAAKASRTSSPFAAGGTEDDGRQRYTLDFMKKHRWASVMLSASFDVMMSQLWVSGVIWLAALHLDLSKKHRCAAAVRLLS